MNKVQGSPTALESALGANDKPQQELGIYGSFRPMIWFFIMLWSILGFVALGKSSNYNWTGMQSFSIFYLSELLWWMRDLQTQF